MLVVQILLGIIILAGVVFLAISRKSGKLLRIAALCALALMVITVIISLFAVFRSNNTTTENEFLQDVMPFEEPARSGPSIVAIILFIVIMIAFFAVVYYLSMREQKRANQPPPPRSDFF